MTASHNRGGMYFRARAIPVNPSSTAQQGVRNSLSVLTARYVETLTPAQRASWELYADNVTVTDKLGDERTLSGINWFVGANALRAVAGRPVVDAGPTVFALADFTEPSIDAPSEATQTFDLNYDNTDAWANEVGGGMAVFVSRPQNPSINFFKGPYRFAGQVIGAATPPTSPATISVPFPITEGQKLFVQLRVFRADGRYSSTFRTGDTVAA